MNAKFYASDLRPRFPLFGGWKTHYLVGYNVPSYEYLFYKGQQRQAAPYSSSEKDSGKWRWGLLIQFCDSEILGLAPPSVSDPDSFFTDPDPGFFSQSGSGSGSRQRKNI